MNKQITTVPALRFPEFVNAGAWDTIELGNLSKTARSGGTPTSTNKKYYDGNIPFLSISDITKQGKYLTHTSKTVSQEGIDNSSSWVVPINTIIYSMYASVGLVSINKIPLATSQAVINITLKDGINIDFVYYYLLDYKKHINKHIEIGTQGNINAEIVKSLNINLPEPEEQQKIADCLSTLDELIAAHTNKLQALKDHKKGLMQNLFPTEGKTTPNYRFPEFVDAAEWAGFLFGDIASFSKGKGISKSDIVEHGALPCIRYGELYTLYGETIEKVVSTTNISPDNLVLSKCNDVIMPASGETQEDIATASCVKKNGIALGGDLNIIRSSNDGVFISYYLNSSKKRDISQISQGISVVHLYSSQLKTLNMRLPKIKEQQKIANCLTALDDLITTQNEKITQLQQHKKGLMQNLFPTS